MTYKPVMDAAFGGDAAASKQLAAVIQRCAGIGASRADATGFAEDVGQELWMFIRQHADRFDPQYELEPYLIKTAFRTAQAMRRRNLSIGTQQDDDDDAKPEDEIPAGMNGTALTDGSTADGDVVDRVDQGAALDYLLRISPELRGINDGSIAMSKEDGRGKKGHAPPEPSGDVAAMKAMVNQQSQSIDALTRMFAQMMQAQAQQAVPAKPPATSAPRASAPAAAPSPAANDIADEVGTEEGDREQDAVGRASLVDDGSDDAAAEGEGAALAAEEPAMMPARKYGRETSEKAALLKTLRQAGGLTQVEMAERLGLKVPTYQSYEYGRCGIPAHVMASAKKVSVTPEYSFIRSQYFGKTMTEIAKMWCKRLRIAPPSPTRLGHILMVNKGTASRWLDPTITVKMTPPELLQYEHRVQAEEAFLAAAVERHGSDVVNAGMRHVVEMDEARQRRAEAQAVAKRAAEIEAGLDRDDKPPKR
ncbi:MAG TPA: helix-turn-helix transcriptional regulator [Rhodanobacteraceae bacterium]